MFFLMPNWKSRTENTTSWSQDRTKHSTYSRKYMLWSFFTAILTAITDPKDWKALWIKTDPKYYIDAIFSRRTENWGTIWKKWNRI